MSLSRYYFDNRLNNFEDFDNILSLINSRHYSNNFLRNDSRNLDMRLDMKEQPNEYILIVDIPGVNKSDIEIDIHNNQLNISAERKREIHQPEIRENSNYYFSERSYGKISRSITIPQNVIVENILAKYENGVLRLSLPKIFPGRNDIRRLHIQ